MVRFARSSAGASSPTVLPVDIAAPPRECKAEFSVQTVNFPSFPARVFVPAPLR